MNTATAFVAALLLALRAGSVAGSAPDAARSVPVFEAVPYVTAETSMFGPLIEGAAVDKSGSFYAVNFNDTKAATGMAFPAQRLLYRDKAEPRSWFNAIRFNVDAAGVQEAYLGDVENHRVVRVRDPGNNGRFAHSETFCASPDMLQPNDLAIAHSSHRLFLSGMRFTQDSVVGDGDLWTCDALGKAKKLGSFRRTNGIELSPDEKTLYVSEASNRGGNVVSNVILAFDVDVHSGDISGKRVFADFATIDGSGANDVDGMRADAHGNLYVARWGAGKIAKLSSAGALVAYIRLPSIDEVTNLELAGPRGTDLFAVGACKSDPQKGCIDTYSAPAQGRAFSNLHA
ncbi:hypothetical protein LPJ57_004200 [Coemansia sp. RSA 486]|nr:hypothetical protein LPJ57_004200 [Coemansia sp. RSA 486]KAJ2230532.1 hypothetical protein IWW45_005763 [Coemansia sp. RSA 485]